MSRLKPVPGICDRCGLRYPLKDLHFEFELGTNTRLRVCKSCDDPPHPQLDTRFVETNDKQTVRESRSDSVELPESRRLYGWLPVGGANTSTYIQVEVGSVGITV